MATIRIGETDFFYECRGKGTPLVLIAGYSCDHTFWDAIYDELTQHFQVLIFDNRGIGQTIDETSTISIDSMAQDTMKIVNALDLKHPIILGQSMGGTIAQTIARDYGNDIQKLIILNSSTIINQRTQMVLSSLLKLYEEKAAFDTLIEASMPWFFSAHYLADPKNIAAYKEICMNNPYPPSPAILRRQLQALNNFNSHLWVNNIQMPTLVIASEDDIVCLPAESEQLASHIKRAKYLKIAGGHSSPLENPHDLIEAIMTI